ncbi:response regulator transcription factor [Lederbergia sp. NSJ-179]|uniref:response regulator transcription factor n=1 Tax=Lederbergia sp. NSJ-179 TaxID=2931402 RepID=UPI001FD446EF|nr:response regulator transcription factor [Lederbergia sp. NSJ-179]MCJ7843465.1 response regulator transcription factor [Lederbergia sp. NSJ-179]
MNDSPILLVDDEISIMQMVEMVLKKEGFSSIYKAKTGKEAMDVIRQKAVDFIVLDVMLPDTNGFDLCEKIREYTDAYILFLTARVTDFDVLTGFEKGGDDYVTKPFNPLEIVARIKAQLRRNHHKKPVPILHHKKRHDFGHFVLDEETGELWVEGKVVPCPAQVFLLLLYFCKHPNRVLSKEQLFTAVWGYEHMADDNTVMVHIRRIRERIEPDPGKPIFLLTVRGLGYKLVKESQS